MERDCDKIKDIEETATRFFTAHANERLGKDADFPFSANSASQIIRAVVVASQEIGIITVAGDPIEIGPSL